MSYRQGLLALVAAVVLWFVCPAWEVDQKYATLLVVAIGALFQLARCLFRSLEKIAREPWTQEDSQLYMETYGRPPPGYVVAED